VPERNEVAGPYCVWVPADPAKPWAMTLAPASAIVSGDPGEGAERVHVYYEGNIYASPQLTLFADRVDRAAGRLIERYPTIAQSTVAMRDLILVGTFDAELGIVTLTGSEATSVLADWLALSGDLDAELVTKASVRQEFSRQLGGYLASPDPGVVQWARQQARRMNIAIR
jgi:hypothetical protein